MSHYICSIYKKSGMTMSSEKLTAPYCGYKLFVGDYKEDPLLSTFNTNINLSLISGYRILGDLKAYDSEHKVEIVLVKLKEDEKCDKVRPFTLFNVVQRQLYEGFNEEVVGQFLYNYEMLHQENPIVSDLGIFYRAIFIKY